VDKQHADAEPETTGAEPSSSLTHHGTVVAWPDGGVFLRGPSGSGKSDLALRLLNVLSPDFPRFSLIADDRVHLSTMADAADHAAPPVSLLAHAPAILFGLLEVRGIGILSMPAQHQCCIRLVVDLVSREDVPRFPANEPLNKRTITLAGVTVPRMFLYAWDQTAALKVALALQVVTGLAAKAAKAHFPG
jgi:HPr kinase/phosphorylase